MEREKVYTKQISIVNPYYAKWMIELGLKIDELKIVEHFFIPTETDLWRITKSIKGCKEIVDIGSGYGLLINELAKRNPDKSFLGIDTMYYDEKFQLPKAEKNVRFEFNGIEAMTSQRNKERKKFDCAICCWVPDQSEWRKMLSYLARKKVILVLSNDFLTGTIETYVQGMKPFGFNIEKRWKSEKSIIQIWRKNDM